MITKMHNFYRSLSPQYLLLLTKKHSKTTNLIMQIIILAHNPSVPYYDLANRPIL